MKHIVFEAYAMTTPYVGVGEFCRQLGSRLGQQAAALRDNHGVELHFIVPPRLRGCFGKDVRYIAMPVPLRHLLAAWPGKVDLFHMPHQYCLFKSLNCARHKLLTIHDINFMYEKKGSKQQRAIRRFQRKIDRADHINYISSFTRNDVRKYFHIDLPERVIYNGATDLSGLRAERPARFSDLPEGFLFHISSLRPKKNVALLVDMMCHLPHERLVIAGDWQSGYGQMLQQKIAGLPTHNIVMLPNVSEAEKAWLYSACKAFLYPSLCEGFGLPPIEAMHFGKPVFLSTLTSLPEIGGKEAFYWDTLLPLPMAERVETALSAFSPAQKSEALKRNAARFDWDTCARQYIQYYLEILGV